MTSKEEVDKLRIAWQEADALSRVYQGLARDAMTAYMTATDEEKAYSDYDPELQRLLKLEDEILKRNGHERTTEPTDVEIKKATTFECNCPHCQCDEFHERDWMADDDK